MAKSKVEIIQERIEELVNAGQEIKIESVDFSDVNRSKTCLEVDFPIIPVNQVAIIEGNAGKPIYQMSKWWARRRSSVFRTMLIAAATKAPDDSLEASKLVWDSYYKNHQENEAFNNLKVADIFMGGGTTVIEGSRLGMQMTGNDLNPIAWMTVKNEVSRANKNEIEKALEGIELEVKPQIMPYYACDCPRGHKGKWLKFESCDVPIKPYLDTLKMTEVSEKEKKKFCDSISKFEGWANWYIDHGYKFEIMDDKFKPFSLTNEERKYYRYWGPEIIYTFWNKHGECQVTGCHHRTPIMVTPIVSVKTLTVKSWNDYKCPSCNNIFDIEEKEARMAPGVPYTVSENEKKYAVLKNMNEVKCPYCGHIQKGMSLDLREAQSKKVDLTLLVHPTWLKGSSSKDINGDQLGGRAEDDLSSTIAWNKERNRQLRLLEVRGKLPDKVTCPETGVTFKTNEESCSNKGSGKFVCALCGTQQKFSESISKTGKDAAISGYAIHGYCPECDNNNEPYNGRFFDVIQDDNSYDYASSEWENRKDEDLKEYWPKSEIVFSHQTHQRDNLPHHGYKHWSNMFNSRQLLVLSQLLRTIWNSNKYRSETKIFILGAYQQYLRNQNMFCIWNIQRDTPEPLFSNNNYHPKMTIVENGVFSDLGRGNWSSCIDTILQSLEWSNKPWETVSNDYVLTNYSELEFKINQKSTKVNSNDKVLNNVELICGSASTIEGIAKETFDLIITDPPFGDNVQYAELSDFFYVWLRLVLKDIYPEYFRMEYTPKVLEAVANKARHSDNPDAFYRKMLGECWKEAYRILKPGGILAFTFHHSEDEPWIAVLESLFEAGFYLEATYPIRSDEIKGEKAEFGSKKIEYDIIHVCRKRMEEQKEVSWAKMRKEVVREIKELKSILENHQRSGLPKADLEVIQKGKALEYFSRHYGKVFVERGKQFTVKEALIGINQLINEESDKRSEAPPSNAEVLTRAFLRIFDNQTEISRDQITKFLRGTAVAPSDFIHRGWCMEKQKMFIMKLPLEIAKEKFSDIRKKISSDYEQAMVLIGACYEDSGIRVKDVLNSNFIPYPALKQVIEWFITHGGDKKIKIASDKAYKLFTDWEFKNQDKKQQQIDIFGLID